jgi:hypothetical protein
MANEDTQPVKRSPGRPRKAAAQEAEHHPKHAAPEPAAADPRIGESVGDERVKGISFPDGTQYRCEKGVIVERVR